MFYDETHWRQILYSFHFSKARNDILILNMNSYCSEQHERMNVHRQRKTFLHPLNLHLQLSKSTPAQGTSHLRHSCILKSESDELILLVALTPETV